MATERMRKMFSMNRDLYDLSEQDPHFGEPTVPLFTTFDNRKECASKGVHAKPVAGISGSIKHGAYSICVSSGYEDDKDNGETLVYTGTGGQSNPFGGTGRQVADQTFEHNDNAALKKSVETQKPVRVVRGPNEDSVYAPDKGYRYDGLYVVEKAYMGKGASGYAICKFELRRVAGQAPIPRK